MKNLRKILALLLSAAISLAMLTGCGNEQQPQSPAESSSPAAVAVSSEAAPEPEKEPETSEQTPSATYEELLDVWTTATAFNADYDSQQIFIQLPHYDGINHGGAICANQGDNTVAFVYAQNPESPASATVQEVLPVNLERSATVMEACLNRPGYEEGKMEITDQKDVTIHDYEMCRYEGTYDFTVRGESFGPYSFVSYAVKTKACDTYVFWMIVDMTEDQSNSKLISENAEKMARTFYEAES